MDGKGWFRKYLAVVNEVMSVQDKLLTELSLERRRLAAAKIPAEEAEARMAMAVSAARRQVQSYAGARLSELR